MDTITMQQCKQLGQATWHEGGYTQTGMGSERTWPQCTCSAYKFSKATESFGGHPVKPPCKHIERVQQTRCSWHELYGVAQTVYQSTKRVCPECGGSTEWVSVAV